MKKSIPILLLGAVIIACNAKLVPPAQPDVDRVSTKYPGYTLDSLNQGMALYRQTCKRCHNLKDPTARTADKWEKIVPTMVAKLNKKKHTTVVNDQQQDQITKYLVTMSGGAKP